MNPGLLSTQAHLEESRVPGPGKVEPADREARTPLFGRAAIQSLSMSYVILLMLR